HCSGLLLFAVSLQFENRVGKLLIWFCVVSELSFKDSALANNAIKGGRKKLGCARSSLIIAKLLCATYCGVSRINQTSCI
ncbi:hypothetical protein, partial [Catenovulum agarivorans]|uniref:hypothetical protein n=1 Tax=Catenovulum agarivorans TaxID=1172192 RepID=UPI001ED91EA0